MYERLALLGDGQYCGTRYQKPLKKLEEKRKKREKEEITDLAIITGGIDKIWTYNFERTNVEVRDLDQKVSRLPMHNRDGIIRVQLLSETIFNILYEKLKKEKKEIVEYGEYPQMAVSKALQKKLESKFNNSSLRKSGNSYTFDSRKLNDHDKEFKPISYDEYVYKDKKYIRVKVNSSFDGEVTLSNGVKCKNGDYVWIEVSNVEWYLDKNSCYKQMYTKKGLLSGIRYNSKEPVFNRKKDCYEIDIKSFINKYMSNEMFRNDSLNLSKDEMDRLNKERIINHISDYDDLFSILDSFYSAIYEYKNEEHHAVRETLGKKYSIINMIEKHGLNITVSKFIMIHYEYLVYNYGYLEKVPKNPYLPYLYFEDASEDEMGFVKRIDANYLEVLKETFKDNMLSPSDNMYICNMGRYDLIKLSEKYPNISLSNIKNIILRGKLKENIEDLLEYLNKMDDDYQNKLLDLINPLVNDIKHAHRLTAYGSMLIKKSMKNENPYELHESKRSDIFDKINMYFLKEFEDIFLEIYKKYKNNMDRKLLNRLLILKNCIIKKIPEPTYRTKYVEKYMIREGETTGYNSYQGLSTGRPRTETYEYSEKYYDKEKEFTLHEKTVLKLKKIVLLLIPMIIENEIDYDKILNSDADIDFVKNIVKELNKQDNKQYCLKK